MKTQTVCVLPNVLTSGMTCTQKRIRIPEIARKHININTRLFRCIYRYMYAHYSTHTLRS